MDVCLLGANTQPGGLVHTYTRLILGNRYRLLKLIHFFLRVHGANRLLPSFNLNTNSTKHDSWPIYQAGISLQSTFIIQSVAELDMSEAQNMFGCVPGFLLPTGQRFSYKMHL